MQPVIAESKLELRRKDGTENAVRIYVRAPYDLNDGSWGCYCHAEGIWEKEVRICGEDSMQALCLAVQFLRIRLQHLVDVGGTIHWPGDGLEPFSIDHCFGATAGQAKS